MSTSSLYIPKRVNVGFQGRTGTYTGKLAYVIYYDHTGKLRKETSWNTWRDKNIPNVEYNNEPIEGFVLNKGVGGTRESYGWNTRNEYIRVYDPRDFEFEISVANLLFILRECDCSKGKGLEGKFVYAWDGTELVLLPAATTDYQQSTIYTDLQGQSVFVKDLIAGATYITKDKQPMTLVYVGKYDFYDIKHEGGYKECRTYKTKKYIFHDGTSFEYLDSLKILSKLQTDTVASNYAELVHEYAHGPHGSKVVSLRVEKTDDPQNKYWCKQMWKSGDGEVCDLWYTQFDYTDKSKIQYIHRTGGLKLNKHGLELTHYSQHHYSPNYRPEYRRYGTSGYFEPTGLVLYAKLENGSEFSIENGKLVTNTNKDNEDGEE